jgi:hypothetical protein
VSAVLVEALRESARASRRLAGLCNQSKDAEWYRGCAHAYEEAAKAVEAATRSASK